MQTSLRKVVGILVGMRQTRVLQSQAAAPKASRVLKNQGQKVPHPSKEQEEMIATGPRSPSQTSEAILQRVLRKKWEREI